MGQTTACVVYDDRLPTNQHYIIDAPERIVELIPLAFKAGNQGDRIYLQSESFIAFSFYKLRCVRVFEKFMNIDLDNAAITLYYVDNSYTITIF